MLESKRDKSASKQHATVTQEIQPKCTGTKRITQTQEPITQQSNLLVDDSSCMHALALLVDM